VFTQKNSYYRSTGILVKETQHAEYPSKYNLKKRFKIQIQFKYLLFLAIKVSKGYHLLSCWEKRKSLQKISTPRLLRSAGILFRRPQPVYGLVHLF
jgi:hypothetical protein